MESSDSDLVERAQNGDAEAYGELVRRHSRFVFATAFKVVGDEALAEDVVQDTFLRAWQRIGRFDYRARFTTWIYRIAVNRAIDCLRRRGRLSAISLDDEASPGEGRLGLVDELSPQRFAEGGEMARRARQALATMSPMERASFVLRHVEGYSIAEIGAVLSTRSSATKQAIFRAVRKMRAALEPYIGEDHEAAVG